MFALAGLFITACSEDYKDWGTPMSYPQEEAVTVPQISAVEVGSIDLNNAGDSVKLVNLEVGQTLPEGAALKNLRMVIAPQGNLNEEITVNALTADGIFAKSDLQSAVVAIFGPRPDARAFDGHFYADVVKD